MEEAKPVRGADPEVRMRLVRDELKRRQEEERERGVPNNAREYSWNRLAEKLGISKGAVRNFLQGGDPGGPAFRAAYDAWGVREGVLEPVPETPPGVLREPRPAFGANGNQPAPLDDQALFAKVLETLGNQDISPGLRVLLIDSAKGAWTAAALYRGAVAEEERARAVHQAELAQQARAEVIRELERNSVERFRVLHPEQAGETDAEKLPPLRHPPESKESGKQRDQA